MYDCRVSVVVPVYNTEKYLKQCLDSILNQSFSEFELILVDDGSSDMCPSICDEFAIKDERIKVIHKENGGPMSAVLDGIKIAQAHYIMFVDSDDWIESELIKLLYKTIEEYKCDLVASCTCKDDGETIKPTKSINISGGYYNRQCIVEDIFPKLLYYYGTADIAISGSRVPKLFKTENVKKIVSSGLEHCIDVRLGEDWLLTMPYIITSSSLYLLPDQHMYHYRDNTQSFTRTWNKNRFWHWKRWIDCLREVVKINNDHDFSEQIESLTVYTALQSLGEIWGGTIIDSNEKRKQTKEIVLDDSINRKINIMNRRLKEKLMYTLIQKKRYRTIILLKELNTFFNGFMTRWSLWRTIQGQ